MTTLTINGVTVTIDPCPTEAPAPAPAPAPAAATNPLLSAGNGWSAMTQGQAVVAATALEAIPAFVAVTQGVNGVQIADGTVEADKPKMLGVAINSAASGLPLSIALHGPVVNNINGSGGWNFVVREPVYVAADGSITQTRPLTGWDQPIGFAISANAIKLFSVGAGSSPIDTRVSVLSFNSVLSVPTRNAEVFDLTLTADTEISLTDGEDGRSITLRLKQDGVGGHAVTFTPAFVGVTVPIGVAAGAEVHYQIQYNGGSGQYVCTSAVTI